MVFIDKTRHSLLAFTKIVKNEKGAALCWKTDLRLN